MWVVINIDIISD